MIKHTVICVTPDKIYTDFYTYEERHIQKRNLLGATNKYLDVLDIDRLDYICKNSETVYLFGLDIKESKNSVRYLFDKVFELVEDTSNLLSYQVTNSLMNVDNRTSMTIEEFSSVYTRELSPGFDIIDKLDIYMTYSFSRLVSPKYRLEVFDSFNNKIKKDINNKEKKLKLLLNKDDVDAGSILTTFDSHKENSDIEIKAYSLAKEITRLEFYKARGLPIAKNANRAVFSMTRSKYNQLVTEVVSRDFYKITIKLTGIQYVILEHRTLEEFYSEIGYSDEKMLNDKKYRIDTVNDMISALKILEEEHGEYKTERVSKTELMLAKILKYIFNNGNAQILLFELSKLEVTFAVDYKMDIHTALSIINKQFKEVNLGEFMARVVVYRTNEIALDEVFDINSMHNINGKNIDRVVPKRKYFATSEEEIQEYKNIMEAKQEELE